MKASDTPAYRVFGWLRENLGPRALGVLTGTDSRHLQAAVSIAACRPNADLDQRRRWPRPSPPW